MRKRGIALFLATALIATMSVPGWAAVNPFSDLRSDHWAYDSVVTLAAAGLVEGYPDGTFGGDRIFTRYEMAMVFARILARFEMLIDAKIDEGIEAHTADLEAQIQATREELTALIMERYDEIRAALQRAGIEVGLGDSDATAGGLTGAPRAALAQHITDELDARLKELASQRDVDELARMIVGIEGGLSDLEQRMLQVEGSTPTRAEAEMIAERVVAAALADRDREIRAALGAAQGDTSSLSELIDAKVDEVIGHMQSLAVEFRHELNTLGVRVDKLEQLVASHDERIGTLENQLGTIHLFGEADVHFRYTGLSGVGHGPGSDEYYQDPRNHDSYKYKAGNEFENRLTLGLAAQPAENVDVKAELVFNDVFGVDGGVIVEPGVNLTLTTPGVLRTLHFGELDLIEQSAIFDQYTLHEKAEVFDVNPGDEEEPHLVRGAGLDFAFGLNDSTNINTLISRVDDDQFLVAAAASYKLSDAFDLTLRGVRQSTAHDGGNNVPPNPYEYNTTVSVESVGTLGNIAYEGTYAQHWAREGGADKGSRAVQGWAEMPLLFATGRLDVASMGSNFYPEYGKDFNSAKIAGSDKELPSDGADWLERVIAPTEDIVAQGDQEVRASLIAPLAGIDATLAVGRRRDAVGTTNNYGQVVLNGIEFAGIDIGVLVDRRANSAREEDSVMRATFDTTILGADVTAAIHNRKNEQGWIPDPIEEEQRNTWLRAQHTMDVGVPLTIEAHYGINEVRDLRASRVALGTEYPVNDFTFKAGYQTETNAVGRLSDDLDLTWWKNLPWTTNDRDSLSVGFDYTIRNLFGTDVNTGYEHRLVRVNGATFGTARNTFMASFEKELRGGEALLAAQAKYITGGNDDEDQERNDRDLIANFKLIYPVFDGTDFKVGGEWTRSVGNHSPEYEVFRLDAGLHVDF